MRRLVPLLTVLCCLTLAEPIWAQGAREVTYTRESVVTLRAKVRFTTMIVLPDQEEILDFVCGDKEFWVVSGAQNLAYVKPAKAGVTTNLNLVTASGRVYSFVLTEGSPELDLKVFVRLDDADPGSVGTPRFFSTHQVDALRKDVENARRDAEDARLQIDAARAEAAKTVEERVNQFRAAFPTELTFPYRFTPRERPFNVTAIFTDGRFTYIHSDPTELPALYEMVDDGVRGPAPNLVNFQVERGVYIVPKILQRGYLAIGKQKLEFETVR
jgi:type IV secretory pathway VirB9-like protein